MYVCIWWFELTLTTEGSAVRLLAPSLGASLRHLAPAEVFEHGRFQAQENRQKTKTLGPDSILHRVIASGDRCLNASGVGATTIEGMCL